MRGRLSCHSLCTQLGATGNNTEGYLMRTVSLVRFSNTKSKWPFVNVSVLHIVEHEWSAPRWINMSRQSISSDNLVFMFKTYAANKPRVYYITQTNVNEAAWYPHADWPFWNRILILCEWQLKMMQSNDTSRLEEGMWVEKWKTGCLLLPFIEAQSDNLWHTIRWVNRPPTTCSFRLSERRPGLVIYSLHSTAAPNLFALQLPKGSDVFFFRRLCYSC